jgi:hypothetical protein
MPATVGPEAAKKVLSQSNVVEFTVGRQALAAITPRGKGLPPYN